MSVNNPHMELASLHKERLAINQKVEENEKHIAHLNKANHWHRKHLKLIDKQIEEDKEAQPSNSELLDEISKGLK